MEESSGQREREREIIYHTRGALPIQPGWHLACVYQSLFIKSLHTNNSTSDEKNSIKKKKN